MVLCESAFLWVRYHVQALEELSALIQVNLRPFSISNRSLEVYLHPGQADIGSFSYFQFPLGSSSLFWSAVSQKPLDQSPEIARLSLHYHAVSALVTILLLLIFRL
jgi:hypothetical protein